MKPWIGKRITELLGGLEDDVLIAYVIEQLEGKKVGRGRGRGMLGGWLEAERHGCRVRLWLLAREREAAPVLAAACSAPPTAASPAQTVDPRQLQISLTGFLEKNTSLFCKVSGNGGCPRFGQARCF